MTIDLVREFTSSITAQASSVQYGRGNLLAVPWSIGHDQTVQIYVEQLADDLFLLTDRGMAADSLGDFEIDLAKPGNRRSWDATVRHGHLPPVTFADVSDLEIATTVSRVDLGPALTALGETVLRTDGLRALSRRKRTTFRERAMARAAQFDLTVVPQAGIPTRYERRRVSFGIERDFEVETFVETIGGRDGLGEFDQARMIYIDAVAVEQRHKIALISDEATVKDWQVEALGEVATVVRESGLESFYRSLAA